MRNSVNNVIKHAYRSQDNDEEERGGGGKILKNVSLQIRQPTTFLDSLTRTTYPRPFQSPQSTHKVSNIFLSWTLIQRI